MRPRTKAAFCSMWILSGTLWNCGEYEEIAIENDATVPMDARLEVSYLDSECRLVERWSASVSELPVRLRTTAAPKELVGLHRIIALRNSSDPHENLVARSQAGDPAAVTLKPVSLRMGERVLLQGVDTAASIRNHLSVYVNPRIPGRWMIVGLQSRPVEFIVSTGDNEVLRLGVSGIPDVKGFSGSLSESCITVAFSEQYDITSITHPREGRTKCNKASGSIFESPMRNSDDYFDFITLLPSDKSDNNSIALWRKILRTGTAINGSQLLSAPLITQAANHKANLVATGKDIFSIITGTVKKQEPFSLFVGLKEISNISTIKKFSINTDDSITNLLPQETFSPQTEPIHLALGDVDRDSHPDLIYSDGEKVFMRQISMLPTKPDQGIFTNAAQKAQQLALGDVNGDAIPDLVLLSNKKVNVHLGTGDKPNAHLGIGDKKNMFAPVPWSVGDPLVEAVEMYVTDLDGDCRAEIVVLDKAGNVFKHSAENPS